jgi:hypothetical protein
VDEEMEVLLARQQSDGFVEKQYLDGNYIRTVLLYASYKMQGVRLDPWTSDISLGAAADQESKKLYIHLSAQKPYKGRLIFDVPRHASFWNLPADYPRVNGQPEWFTVEASQSYIITGLVPGKRLTMNGQELARGWPVEMPAGVLSITLEKTASAALKKTL